MTITLTTHATRNYLPRMAPYLDSLRANCPWPVHLLTVDCDAPAEFMARWPNAKAARVPKVAGSPENTDSLQHGAFLPYVSGDILIYTDGDIVMQRPPSADEVAAFADLQDGEVYCGWNSGPGETLAVEGARLFPHGDLAAAWGDLSAPCYNIGVIAATRGTWQRLWDHYLPHYEQAVASFGAQQRQQWLVCYVMARYGFSVKLMPHSVHLHGCYALPDGALFERGEVTFGGVPVLFRHHL